MRLFRSLLRDRAGNAAAEFALALPLLLILMFGAFEVGAFFYTEHKVVKSVRDGARFASRQPFAEFAASTCAPSGTVVGQTRNVTLHGRVTGGAPRLAFWTDPTTVTVSAACSTASGGGVAWQGIYRGRTDGAPVVTVAAAVPYVPFVARIGLASTSLTLNASSTAAVNGI